VGAFFSHLVEAVSKSMSGDTGVKKSQVPTLEEAVARALHDWRSAEQSFNFVTDPDLIDQAIYTMEANRKRYSYLLNRLREGCNPDNRAY